MHYYSKPLKAFSWVLPVVMFFYCFSRPANVLAKNNLDVAIINNDVSDYGTISKALKADTIIIADSSTSASSILSGLSQSFAARGKTLASLSIFSHGQSGSFHLGSTTIDGDNFTNAVEALYPLIGITNSNSNILIYGCESGKGTKGQNLLSSLKGLIKGNFYLSTNKTGSGGDWNLELTNSTANASGIADTSYLDSNYSYSLQVVPSGYTMSRFCSGSFGGVEEITIDRANSMLYFSIGSTSGYLYKVPSTGVPTLIATNWANYGFFPYLGTDFIYDNGYIYCQTSYNSGSSNTLTKVNVTNGSSTYVNTGTNVNISLEAGCAANGNIIYYSDGEGSANMVMAYNTATQTTSTVVTGLPSNSSYETLDYNAATDKLFYYGGGIIYRIDPVNKTKTQIAATTLGAYSSMAVDPQGAYAYILAGTIVYQVNLSTGTSSIFASGLNSSANYDLDFGPSSNGTGYSLYIGGNSVIYEVKGFTGASANSIATNTITGSPFCAGGNVFVKFTPSGSFGAGNEFKVQLSDNTGSFASPATLDSTTGTSGDTLTVQLPASASGNGYRIRVVSTNPAVTGTDNGSNLVISNLSAIAGSNVTINSGQSTTLGATADAGSTYSWVSSPAGFTSTDANPTVNPTTTTTYTVTETNSNGCSNSNSVTVTVNPPAGALNFNGSNYVSLNSSLTNVGTGDFTIQLNLRFTSSAGMYFLSKRGVCGGDNFISMQVYQGKIGMETHDWVNYTGFSGTTAINDGKWHQVSAVRKSGTLYIYIDGSLDASAASTSNLNSSYILNLGTSVCVGQNGNSNYSGDMDEVRFWNRALCQAELSNNKTCELSGTQTGLVAYYKFNQGYVGADNTSETSLTDATGNGNTGTLHSFTLKGSSSNWVTGLTTSCSAFSNPMISLAGNSTAITNGSTTTSTINNTDFGQTTTNTISKSFTISNGGSGSLTVSSIGLSGVGASNFSVSGITLPATVAVNGSTTFTITFNSSTTDVKNATVTINNDDCNNPTFTFNVKGQQTCTLPVFTSCPANINTTTSSSTCNAVLTYSSVASATPAPVVTYSFSGATTASGTGTGSGMTFNKGTTNVTVTATNSCGSQSCTFYVTVSDKTAPVVRTKNAVAYLDANGRAGISASDIDNGTSDNCGSVTLSLDKASFNCSDLGSNTVTLTATDADGNTSTASAIVTVKDAIAPTAAAQNVTIYLDGNGRASTTASAVDNGSTDNCTVSSLSLSKTAFDCSNLGDNNVTLTVTDERGNTSTASALVMVKDDIAPTAAAQNLTLYLDAYGKASTSASAIDNGSADNCAIASMNLSKTSFDCSNLGDNNVTLTVTDKAGNTSTASAVVTVKDMMPPAASAKNVTIYLDANGKATTTATDVNDGSADNCTIASLSLSKTSFDCSNLGDNNVTLIVTDENGNASTASAVVTVKDVVAPTATAQNVIVYLDANGKASTTAAAVDNGSSDNCTVASLSLSKASFDCSNVGDNNVTLTVTDESGNASTASAIVTVKDTTSATVKTQNVTLYLDANGKASTSASAINNGSYDNCGIASYTLSKTSFDCSNVGDNTVTLTIVDNNGNKSAAGATVTIKDTTVATVKTQSLTLYLDANGSASTTAKAVDNGSFDNCGIASLNLDKTSFGCANVGDNTVTLTVTDNNHNVSTGTATITVKDTIKPVAKAKNLSVTLDATTGTASVTAAQIDNGSYDNCSYTLSLDKTSFSCSNLGDNTVILTVTDASGNVRTATAVVTVKTTLTVDAGADLTVYYGYSPMASATLKATPSGGKSGYTYKWSTGATTQSITVSPSSTTTYTVTVTDANGCIATDAVKVIVVDVRCSSGNSGKNDKVMVCHKGNTLCLDASAVSAHLGHGDNIGQCPEGKNSEVEESAPQNFGNSTAAVSMNPESKLEAFPNPFFDKTTVRFTLAEAQDNATLAVYDIKGVMIGTLYQGHIMANTPYQFEINAAQMTSGVYFVRLLTGEKVQYVRLVVTK